MLAVLFVLEMGYKMTKRTMVIMGLWRWGRGWLERARWWRGKQVDWMDGNLEDWDLGMWQEMEQDKMVKERLRGILDAEERGVGDAEEEEPVQVLGAGERAVA